MCGGGNKPLGEISRNEKVPSHNGHFSILRVISVNEKDFGQCHIKSSSILKKLTGEGKVVQDFRAIS